MKKILIVDDDPGIQDAFRLVFPPDQFEVEIHSNGQMLLDGKYQVPDIFLLDKQLSGVDGLELCRILKAADETKFIPVVVLSASPHIRGPALAAGADAVIEKPFSLSELRRVISIHMK